MWRDTCCMVILILSLRRAFLYVNLLTLHTDTPGVLYDTPLHLGVRQDFQHHAFQDDVSLIISMLEMSHSHCTLGVLQFKLTKGHKYLLITTQHPWFTLRVTFRFIPRVSSMYHIIHEISSQFPRYDDIYVSK